MPNASPTVDNLMKVSLNVSTGNAASNDDTAIPFSFIYGVGTSGITPFEKALFAKGIGDHIQFDLASSGYCETLGHLEEPLRQQTGITSPVSLQVTITDVVRSSDREVVKAMAAGGSCSDCGCGCGGH